VCGRDWGGIGGVSLCCVWDSLGRVWGSDFVLCVGAFGVGLGECVCAVCGRVWAGLGELDFCRVWERLVWVWGSEFVLCLVEFGAGLGE